MSFQILGTGSFVPERVVTNEELSQMVDTSDEWIVKRIGVRKRRVCTSETVTDLGVEAARRALADAGVQPEELDLIIAATISADTISPGLGGMVQNRLGARCPAFDMNVACPGFLFALDVAAGFFARKAVKKVLVVSAERMSGLMDWEDRATCCIFGDGAGAVVLGEGDAYLASELHTQGGDDIISIPVKWDNSPFYQRELPKNKVNMEGQATYKFAVTSMVSDIKSVLEKAGITGEQVKAVIPHQANYRIINEARRRLPEIAPEKFLLNIEEYGNTSSASEPLLLDEARRKGMFQPGDYILLSAFGGGLSSASCVVRWTKAK
ncbi:MULTISPECIES: beta-ketoacyl-ACP synthase III [Eubacteriales]|jgi:3-oxoacyl-[acyl-carrier-protein] synthase-3|uniref:beta-ketoacyl-ACP synthase III n=1 Tax=Eubacteriales TaxID=186802 RepID=UPI0013689879|nr:MULTISPECIES: beta-ketoacyl-ACP synthase III [unclassified Neglectibacter]MCI9115847.1 ketoacyl-ACP synthase III [Acutalibacter sp.]NBI17270.1 ketoacyl-ACP synthase III [Neglectibacter sp. 59]NBJ72882.1 ketoacyl-ACP synthase III [Neglectibacter sp. X4]NCE80766.1 ketoacyl-ACP synthase III [Neglectibacter sp. X58]